MMTVLKPTKGVKTGVGYKMYIQKHMSDGPVSEVEYRAFLNMWLCVTTPPEIIPYYHLNHSIWSLSDNKEASR
jgi:hypothetical protein